MASIHLISDELPEEPEVWNLRLTRTEAGILRAILGNMCGSFEGPRKHAHNIYVALRDAKVELVRARFNAGYQLEEV